MSTTAHLTELRAERAAQALVDIHRALDASVLDDLEIPEPALERLWAIREVAVLQLERLAARVRRNDALREAIVAACRTYRAWASHAPGSSQELRSADELAVAVLRLRSALGVTVALPAPGAEVVTIGLADTP